MNINKISQYWIINGKEKWKTAGSLLQSRRYADALFYCHLALEAQLKAVVAFKTKKFPPLTHNLLHLAYLTGLELPSRQIEELKEITTFNIKTRYDDYKFSFYKKATKKYAEKYFKITEDLYLWIKKNTPSKK
ncbi:MAG: hypothetical protein A2Y00_05215 [Omnitrophica WOR_2 bacterium GWF2_43_52]|nr:MAG: hypothetical protein A2062_02255 [Omnitrophica WOR_2 bacterium GWA2_44_7]OGX18050.1 MAG: hypothetical protein A2Y01_02690 [Omnitrophica WOR_2 bacterium GWC2_44_8]OGX20504.1 MAG: hypothetical protein A2Y00_05215 [Omnitrophica WOR_2 bacterium GWF2_43_52]OGX56097.1 MAG: hypothetical protein A2460_08835 [Omnitrophica WOR_2 bacterium RIFOXYC2_FULL_43_9]HAH20559.1 DNA-binding protein [Candidatus Omnitrophota bacterium]